MKQTAVHKTAIILLSLAVLSVGVGATSVHARPDGGFGIGHMGDGLQPGHVDGFRGWPAATSSKAVQSRTSRFAH